MAASRFSIESFLDSMELKYYTQEGENISWIIMFASNIGVVVNLGESGEYLLFRSLPLIDQTLLSPEKRNSLNTSLLKLNNSFKIGHYCVDDDVVVEAALPIEDGELTANQFRRCFSVVCREATTFRERLPVLLGEENAKTSEDAIGNLISRLIDGSPSED
jgi:hypothetical protein